MFLKKRQAAEIAASALAFIALISGCSSDADITTTLRNFPLARESAAVRRAITDQSSAVTIESLKMPITQIALSRGDGLYGSDTPWVLYECSGATDADCLADLAANGTNQLAPGEIKSSLPPGTYTSLMVATCKDASSLAANKFPLSIKARIVVGGESLFTKAGSPQLVTVEAQYSPFTFTFPNCRTYYVLNQPFVVVGGETLTFAIYNDLRANSTVYRFASSMSILDGVICSANAKPYLCVHPPSFFVTTNGQAPVVERYRLRNTSAASEANKVIGIALDSDGAPIGGYFRAYLDGTQDPTSYVPFPGDFKRIGKTGEVLGFTNFWTDNALNNFSTIASPGNFTVKAFPRPGLGAGAVSLPYEDQAGVAQSAPAFTVERID